MGPSVGLSPIVSGQLLKNDSDEHRTLLLSPQIGAIKTIEIRSEGLDLIVRFTGSNLSTLAVRPDAPNVPAFCSVRVRRRTTDWRFIADGLCETTLSHGKITPSPMGFLANLPLGTLRWRGPAEIDSTCIVNQCSYSTLPLLEQAKPYERVQLWFNPAP